MKKNHINDNQYRSKTDEDEEPINRRESMEELNRIMQKAVATSRGVEERME